MAGDYSVKQDIGNRKNQEDAYFSAEQNEQCLFIIADGMGGYSGGAQASKIVVDAFSKSYFSLQQSVIDNLQQSLQSASESLQQVISNSHEFKRMGSTLVSVLVYNNLMDWISVGDSPLWLFRDQQLIRVNEDHSMGGVFVDLVALGRMTQEEADNDPRRHTLRSVINADPIKKIDYSTRPETLKSGDLILIASDGLQTLNEQMINDILQESHALDSDAISQNLLDAVLKQAKSGQDNSTLIVYKHNKKMTVE